MVILVACLVTMEGVRAEVVVRPWRKEAITLEDMEATFGLTVPNHGLRGKLHIAEPLNACKPLTNGPSAKEKNPFVVIGSGQCNNVLKVKNAQNAGFMAVLLFNVEDEPEFINMEGNATDITVYAVAVSKNSGRILLKEAEDTRTDCYLMPSVDFRNWTGMEIAAFIFVSLCVVVLALAMFLCVRRHQLHERQRALEYRPLLD